MKRFGMALAGRRQVRVRGRKKALATLDRILEESGGQDKRMEELLEQAFDRDPVKFFIELVMPLLPRETIRSCDDEGVVRWQTRPAEGERKEASDE